jgi:hypothetical protein
MGKIHKDKPLARLAMIGDFPICVAKDGTIIVAFQWDYAAWTAGAAAFTDDVQKLAAQSGKNRNVLVALSGRFHRDCARNWKPAVLRCRIGSLQVRSSEGAGGPPACQVFRRDA